LNDPLDPFDTTNLVIVTAIIVSDTTVNTAAGLNPPANTANDDFGSDGGGGGGGGFGLLGIFGLLLVRGVQRRSC
jgi:peptidyl-prolyl cis-trans isomerase A (cyclophilin A)